MAHICGAHFQNKHLVVFHFMVISLLGGQGWGRQEALLHIPHWSLLFHPCWTGCWRGGYASWNSYIDSTAGKRSIDIWEEIITIFRGFRDSKGRNPTVSPGRKEGLVSALPHYQGLRPPREKALTYLWWYYLWRCDSFKFLVLTAGIVETII